MLANVPTAVREKLAAADPPVYYQLMELICRRTPRFSPVNAQDAASVLGECLALPSALSGPNSSTLFSSRLCYKAYAAAWVSWVKTNVKMLVRGAVSGEDTLGSFLQHLADVLCRVGSSIHTSSSAAPAGTRDQASGSRVTAAHQLMGAADVGSASSKTLQLLVLVTLSRGVAVTAQELLKYPQQASAVASGSSTHSSASQSSSKPSIKQQKMRSSSSGSSSTSSTSKRDGEGETATPLYRSLLQRANLASARQDIQPLPVGVMVGLMMHQCLVHWHNAAADSAAAAVSGGEGGAADGGKGVSRGKGIGDCTSSCEASCLVPVGGERRDVACGGNSSGDHKGSSTCGDDGARCGWNVGGGGENTAGSSSSSAGKSSCGEDVTSRCLLGVLDAESGVLQGQVKPVPSAAAYSGQTQSAAGDQPGSPRPPPAATTGAVALGTSSERSNTARSATSAAVSAAVSASGAFKAASATSGAGGSLVAATAAGKRATGSRQAATSSTSAASAAAGQKSDAPKWLLHLPQKACRQQWWSSCST